MAGRKARGRGSEGEDYSNIPWPPNGPGRSPFY